MKSMTGFGKSEKELSGKRLLLEIKTVNNRFLDFNIRMPKNLYFLEDALRKELQTVLKRGRVDVSLTYSDNSESQHSVAVDFSLAEGYVVAARGLRDKFGLEDDFQLSSLMRLPDVVKPDSVSEDEELLTKLLSECAKEAVRKLDSMRVAEGEAMKKDLEFRLDNVCGLVARVKEFAPQVAEEYRTKLENRMREVLESVQVDEEKLLNEVAFFADRSNIDEEIARLESHIAQLRKMFEEREPVGRKLDFLVQEFNREANTVCSKSNNIVITNIGLELKCEIEKIREQIQNIE